MPLLKVVTMKIEIVEDLKDRMDADNAYVKQVLRRGKIDAKRAEKTLMMTPKIFSKVFSPERIRLLQKIYKNDIKSIYQLAKELDKPYEVVFRNIKYLEGIGLIKLVKKDNKQIPTISSKLSIDMFSEVCLA